MYSTLKLIHIGAAIVTICGFALRGYWMLTAPEYLERRAVRVLPHVVDALLLVTGIALVTLLGTAMLGQPWLQLKLTALVAYILLGMVALRRGPTRASRAAAFALALLTFAYIAGAALSKSGASWLAWLA